MRLRDWIANNDYTQARLANELGISRQYVSDIVRGRYVPSSRLITIIRLLTSGDVTHEDFGVQECVTRKYLKRRTGKNVIVL